MGEKAEMTEVCAECGYRPLCEDFGYELNCACRNECSHYDAFLEGEELALMAE